MSNLLLTELPGYVAVDNPDENRCEECDLRGDPKCPKVGCGPFNRNDGRHVMWKKKEVTNG